MDEYLAGIMSRPRRFDECSRYRWVEPGRGNRTKEKHPYGYSEHYLWGERTDDSSAVYSDRLSQWDSEKSRAALAAVADLGCRYGYWGSLGTSQYLSAYFGRPVDAVAVAEGCNVSNGYPYHIFWFRETVAPNTPVSE